MLSVLIVEDEQLAAERIQRMLLNVDESIKIAGVLGSISSVIKWFRENESPDLMLLDIQLSDGSSFDIFEELDIGIPVIFTTAYDQFAIEAFKLTSIDYLLKPIRKSELSAAIDKYRKMFTNRDSLHISYDTLIHTLKPKSDYQKRIIIRAGHRIKAMEIQDVAYFYIEAKITLMRMVDGNTYPIDFNLEQLEQILDPKQFFRINRQFIISFQAIGEMFAYSKSRVKIETHPKHQEDLIVSSDRSHNFKRWLTGNDRDILDS